MRRRRENEDDEDVDEAEEEGEDYLELILAIEGDVATLGDDVLAGDEVGEEVLLEPGLETLEGLLVDLLGVIEIGVTAEVELLEDEGEGLESGVGGEVVLRGG